MTNQKRQQFIPLFPTRVVVTVQIILLFLHVFNIIPVWIAIAPLFVFAMIQIVSGIYSLFLMKRSVR